MLPLELLWYRRLPAVAAVLGAAGRVLGLVYPGGTGAAIDHLYGDADTPLWSGP
jgi:hypothetical protein